MWSRIFYFLCVLPVVYSGLVLSDFIRHFQPLHYDHKELSFQHHRLKRDVTKDLKIQFIAHDRLFKLRLWRDTSLFADDAVLESTEGPIETPSEIFVGHLEDEENSHVEGILSKNSLLDGTVYTPHEVYFIEPSDRYFETPEFHSVIYRASDVISPAPNKPCASHELFKRQLEEHESYFPKSLIFNKALRPLLRPGENTSVSKATSSVITTSLHPNLSSSESGQLPDTTQHNPPPPRQILKSPLIDLDFLALAQTREDAKNVRKRAILDPRKTTCMLYLQADHLFYEKLGSEEACIEAMTRHVQRVNSIYKSVDFDNDGVKDNITFMIKRIKVHTGEALNDPSYRFPGNYGVEKFLELFSEEDYDAFCLAYMFTYRDFEGGTLGLAWTGDLKNAGGVCEKNGHYRGSLKSLNTGIVTLLNYGKHVPPAVSHVTLAHEIGHNFGSPHDPENNKDCTPGGEDGNYIMFARATSGDKRNNNKFSPCSLNSINSVLNAKARDQKGCFTEPQMAICGNGVVEPGEECDCGWEKDCKEECCYPMSTTIKPHQRPCHLKPRKICSPSQGPCCTDNCHLKYGDKCRGDNGCRGASYCDGSGPQCPPSTNKPNKTICNEEFVCYRGECTGSICIAYGLESCQCIRGPNDVDTKACELCCKLPGEDQPCLSSFDWNIPPYDIPDLYAKAGTPCNNYNGYCDVFQKCREVDPSGPLATLRKLLLSDESIASVKMWMKKHWYTVLLVIAGFIIIMVTIARLFGKVPQKKQKKLTVYHNDNNAVTSTTYQVQSDPATSVKHTVHPTAVRSHIPFKKRVREDRKKTSKRSAILVSEKVKKSSRHGTRESVPDRRPESEKRRKTKIQKGLTIVKNATIRRKRRRHKPPLKGLHDAPFNQSTSAGGNKSMTTETQSVPKMDVPLLTLQSSNSDNSTSRLKVEETVNCDVKGSSRSNTLSSQDRGSRHYLSKPEKRPRKTSPIKIHPKNNISEPSGSKLREKSHPCPTSESDKILRLINGLPLNLLAVSSSSRDMIDQNASWGDVAVHPTYSDPCDSIRSLPISDTTASSFCFGRYHFNPDNRSPSNRPVMRAQSLQPEGKQKVPLKNVRRKRLHKRRELCARRSPESYRSDSDSSDTALVVHKSRS